MTDINMKKVELGQLSLKKTKNLEIGRLQTSPQGRRIVGFSKIEYQWKVQDRNFPKE